MPVSNLHNLHAVLSKPYDTTTNTHATTEDQIERAKQKSKDCILRMLGIDPKETGSSGGSNDILVSLQRYIENDLGNESLGKILFGDKFKLSENQAQTKAALYEKIENSFDILNARHKYFSKDKKSTEYAKEFKAYESCYLTTHYARKVLQDGNAGLDDEIAYASYKMTVMCYRDNPERELDTLNKATDVLKNFSQGSKQPLHDVFSIYNIPAEYDATKFDIGAWRLLLTKDTTIVLKAFARAAELQPHFTSPLEPLTEVILKQAYPAEYPGLAEDIVKAIPKSAYPRSAEDIVEAIPKLNYKRFNEYPDLAKLYTKYNVEVGVFDRSLNLIRDGVIYHKVSDNIPSVVVDFGVVDRTLRGKYYLVKLPKNDMRALILGKITNCCQSISSDERTTDAEQVVISGATLPHNGFYVVIKVDVDKKNPFDPNNIDWSLAAFEGRGHKIVGQTYVWRSTTGNITGDSIEMLKDHENLPILKVLQQMGKLMVEQDPYIERVTVGLGGKTKEINDFKGVKSSKFLEKIHTGKIYDANDEQFEAWNQDKDVVKTQREELVKQLLRANKIDNSAEKWLSQITHLDRFKYLTSYDAIKCYEQRYCTFDELKEWSAERIEVLTSKKVQELVYERGGKFADIHKLDLDIIETLTSRSEFVFCRDREATFTDLKELFEEDFEKFNLITSKFSELYKLGAKFCDLKDLDINVIRHLLSFVSSYNGKKACEGKFNNLAQHCIFEFIQYTKISVANEKIPQNDSY